MYCRMLTNNQQYTTEHLHILVSQASPFTGEADPWDYIEIHASECTVQVNKKSLYSTIITQ